MTRTASSYECPECRAEVEVGDVDDFAQCGECGRVLEVDRDGSYDDGAWHDLTALRARAEDAHAFIVRTGQNIVRGINRAGYSAAGRARRAVLEEAREELYDLAIERCTGERASAAEAEAYRAALVIHEAGVTFGIW